MSPFSVTLCTENREEEDFGTVSTKLFISSNAIDWFADTFVFSVSSLFFIPFDKDLLSLLFKSKLGGVIGNAVEEFTLNLVLAS